MLIGAIEETYNKTLRNNYAGYGNQSNKEILEHKYDNYEDITVVNIANNDMAMKEHYDNNKSFENIIDYIDSAVEFTSARENCTQQNKSL